VAAMTRECPPPAARWPCEAGATGRRSGAGGGGLGHPFDWRLAGYRS
jgi:hypothetical protein